MMAFSRTLTLIGLVSLLCGCANGYVLVPVSKKTSVLRRVPSITTSIQVNNGFSTRDSIRIRASTADELQESPFSSRRISYLALWVGLFAYATDFSSHISAEAEAASAQILNTAIFTPFDGTLSPVFVTLFFFLGILPTVFGSLLLPASKQQQFWALPFVASSFALGFFGIGPYLGLREKSPNPQLLTSMDRDTGASFFDNKITPYALLASTLYLIYFALNGAYDGSDRWQDYLALFDTQPLARISTIDFTILSLAVRVEIMLSFLLCEDTLVYFLNTLVYLGSY